MACVRARNIASPSWWASLSRRPCMVSWSASSLQPMQHTTVLTKQHASKRTLATCASGRARISSATRKCAIQTGRFDARR
eukprot:scaffold7366_cov254-Pinguiococcus_pyrenoidosus.AAC.3